MKKIIATISVVSILSSATFAYAEGNTKNLNDELSKNRAKQESLDIKIESVNKSINELESKIEKSSNEISILEDEMDKSQEEIDRLSDKIEENKEYLGERIKVINGNYSMNMISVILSSDSISDFFSNMYIVKKVVEQDKELLEELNESKEEVETRQADIEDKKIKQENLKNELEEDSNIIEEEKKELQSLRNELESKEEALHDEITKIAEEAAKKQQEEKEEAEANKNNSNTNNNGGGSSSDVIASGSWPVPGHTRISSPYGYRTHPVLGTQKLHTGIDIPAPSGTPIVSVDNGTVVYSGVQGSYGNVVMVQHSGGKLSLYAHNSQNVVSVGQTVKKGQMIAKIGSTGMSTGPHVHFEIRINGQHTNPTAYVTP